MGDETSWPNSSYADVHNKFVNKKTDKGGQHVMLLDARRRYMYAYTPRHKFYEPVAGWTAMGPVEVKRVVELMNPLIKGRLDWQPENHPHFRIGAHVNLLKAKPGSKSGSIGHLSGPVKIVGIGDNTITIEYRHGGQKKRSDVNPERLEKIEK